MTKAPERANLSRVRSNVMLGPCIRSEANVNDNELILALHDLLDRVEKGRGINAAAAHTLLADMAELAAEERGAFLEEETL